MRYAHYCESCDARSPHRHDDYEAKRDRDLHRRIAHHRLEPRDRIEEIPGPIHTTASALLSGAAAGARRAARSHGMQQMRQTTYWKQAVRLLWISAVVLFLLSLLLRRHP
ncbi:hypothetical protein EYS09_22220 [Streptomyces kasugaensis]|uniref:Uncharacterized protein n=1 Tax=Streptomyces kasugaensis TaxID=1946 RepID=A0A4Q9HTL8_STRKA|nr:hypothetical protein [Streptomyces kasugaensis]TBO57530.1 hypothetical protein EYS09_22220 [Streptomyces kasugaensis]